MNQLRLFTLILVASFLLNVGVSSLPQYGVSNGVAAPGVNFINILRTPFPPIFWRQKLKHN